MGQRTAIILIGEDKKGNKKVELYHDQWGIGRKMPLAFMSFFAKFYNSEKSYNETKSFLDTHCEISSYKDLKIHHEYTWFYNEKGESIKGIRRCFGKHERMSIKTMPMWSDFQNSKTIGETIIDGFCDNNNGAMVIYAKEREDEKCTWQSIYDMKIGFLMGHEDEIFVCGNDVYNKENKKYGKAYDIWLTPEEYLGMRINNKYADKKFQKLFMSFLNYFEISVFGKNEDITGNSTN